MELKKSPLSQVVLWTWDSHKYLNYKLVSLYNYFMQSLTYVDAELWSCTGREGQYTTISSPDLT